MLRQLGGALHGHASALKGLAVVLFLLALVVLAHAVPLGDALASLTAEIDTFGPWGPVLFGAVVVFCAVVVLPLTPLALLAGALFGPFVGLAVISVASTGAASLSFLLGRLGRAAAAHHAGRFRRLAAVYRVLGEGGWKLVVAVRLSHAMPFGVQNYLFGMTPIRFLPYVLATWVAMLPGTILYAYLGHLLGAAALEAGGAEDTPAGPWAWAMRGLAGAVLVVAVFYVGRLVRGALRESASHDLAERGLSPALAEQAAGPTPAWPWGTALLLLASVLALTGATWAWVAQERVQQAVSRWGH